MKQYCKLTNQDGYTRRGKEGETKWGVGVTHSAVGTSDGLCSNGWIHFYESPLIAVLMNPIHANIKNPLLWSVKIDGQTKFEPLKAGCKTLTTIKLEQLPVISLTSKIAFGILCSLEVSTDKKYTVWAYNWLSNKDRTYTAAQAAAYAADAHVDAGIKIDFNKIAKKALKIK